MENVEFPVSWLAVSTEVAKPEPEEDITTNFHLMLYLVGEALSDGGSTSACAAAGTLVHSRAFPTLPEDLVEEVLLRLPAASQASCRAVCKAWRAMFYHPEFPRRSFLQSFSRTMPPPLCAVKDYPAEYLRKRPYVSPLYKALKVSLSFLPKVFHPWTSQLHICSQSGFMCIRRLVKEGMHLCVFNPVNQSFKVLPMLEKLWGSNVTLSMGTVLATESIPCSFKVYVCGVEPARDTWIPNWYSFSEPVAIYSSISGEWKGFLRPPGEERFLPPISCNGYFYTTVNSTSPRLVRLSTERGPRYLWHLALPDFERPPVRYRETEFRLACYRGRLLFCSGGIWMLDDARELLFCSGGIWMLDDARELWVEIAGRCPPDILPYADPKRHNLELYRVCVAGDLVFFYYELHFTDGHRRPKDVDPVAYDMLGRFWRKVPQDVAQAGELFQAMPNLRL